MIIRTRGNNVKIINSPLKDKQKRAIFKDGSFIDFKDVL